MPLRVIRNRALKMCGNVISWNVCIRPFRNWKFRTSASEYSALTRSEMQQQPLPDKCVSARKMARYRQNHQITAITTECVCPRWPSQYTTPSLQCRLNVNVSLGFNEYPSQGPDSYMMKTTVKNRKKRTYYYGLIAAYYGLITAFRGVGPETFCLFPLLIHFISFQVGSVTITT